MYYTLVILIFIGGFLVVDKPRLICYDIVNRER